MVAISRQADAPIILQPAPPPSNLSIPCVETRKLARNHRAQGYVDQTQFGVRSLYRLPLF